MAENTGPTLDWSDDKAGGDEPPLERVHTKADAGPFHLEIGSLTRPGTSTSRAITFVIYLAGAMLWLAASTATLSGVVKAPRWISTAAGLSGTVVIVTVGVRRTAAPRSIDVRRPSDRPRHSASVHDRADI